MNLHRCEPNLFLLILCLAGNLLLVVPLLIGKVLVRVLVGGGE